MTIQLNLNQYYENLDLSDINEIFSSFINMKTYVDQYYYLQSDKRENEIWERYWKICRRKLVEQGNQINKLMERLGKPQVFDIKDIDDTDFEAMLKKYEYLMSKPEIEKPEEKKIEGMEPGDN